MYYVAYKGKTAGSCSFQNPRLSVFFLVLFDNNGEPVAGAPGPGRDAVTRAFEDWARTCTVTNAGVHRAAVTVQGEAWNVLARSITHGTGFAWTVVVAVPDEAFMGP